MTAYTYSVFRVVPDPVRGEFANIGLVMVDDHGEYSKLIFNYRIQTRVRALGGRRLVQPVLRELGDISSSYDVSGPQSSDSLRLLPSITVEDIRTWATDRGGILRMTAPRVVVADEPDVAFEGIYQRYVRGAADPDSRVRITPEAERAQLRDRFIRAISRLQNFDSSRVRVGSAVQGVRAHHWLDVAVVGEQIATAFAHAIPMRSTDDRALFTNRGLVLEAADDWPVGAPKIALYDDPLEERRDLFDETSGLMESAGVRLINPAALADAVRLFEEPLWTPSI